MAWTPLMYLAYGRARSDLSAGDAERSMMILLQHGADPNAGYLWQGLVPPFTVLTGLFGDGEQGSVNDPPHPQAIRLATLLLDAGADPNDGQTLYNRMFSPADDHLELLLHYGLGRGDGGAWHRKLPGRLDSPALMLRAQLIWAITHDMRSRIRLLAGYGVDLASPLENMRWPGATPLTPVQLALQSGQGEAARLLIDLGAPPATDTDLRVARGPARRGGRTGHRHRGSGTWSPGPGSSRPPVPRPARCRTRSSRGRSTARTTGLRRQRSRSPGSADRARLGDRAAPCRRRGPIGTRPGIARPGCRPGRTRSAFQCDAARLGAVLRAI